MMRNTGKNAFLLDIWNENKVTGKIGKHVVFLRKLQEIHRNEIFYKISNVWAFIISHLITHSYSHNLIFSKFNIKFLDSSLTILKTLIDVCFNIALPYINNDKLLEITKQHNINNIVIQFYAKFCLSRKQIRNESYRT